MAPRRKNTVQVTFRIPAVVLERCELLAPALSELRERSAAATGGPLDWNTYGPLGRTDVMRLALQSGLRELEAHARAEGAELGTKEKGRGEEKRRAPRGK